MSFCYSYLDLSDIKSYETVIDIPLVGPDSIFMSNVADKYYNEIILTVQQDYFNNQFSNKRLISVDLEPINGGDSLWISSLIGNNSSLLLPQYDWKYGNEAGTCDGNYYVTESDAAKELAKNVRQHFYEEPPAGYKWSFLNIETKTVKALTQNENGEYKYINENDETPLDNYKDYLIFYATSNNAPIVDSTICVPQYNEYQFYKQNYINITQDLCGDKYFKDCFYEGYDETDVTLGYQLIHKLQTTIGTRIKVNFNVPTDDIATY